jgi:hypothetical protein
MKTNLLRLGFWTILLGTNLQLYPHALAVSVTNLNDSGPGSIRQAIADTPAGGTIDFAVTGTVVLTTGQLVITNDLTVNGPGATNLTLSQNSTNRIMVVSNGTVSISGLTIANGNCLTDDGDGGGIKNLASLTLRNCLIMFNRAATLGGGIASRGPTTVIGSTICSNTANLTGFWITAGGIHALGLGHLVVSNSTVSANQQSGIFLWGGDGTTVTVSGSTLANNQQGDIDMEFGSAVVRNSIIKTCGGGLYTSEDYNLIQNHSFQPPSTFIGATHHNLYGLDPKLGPLADHGGPTPTHALRFDSPAIDAGHSGSAATDQRGLPRPVDDPSTPNAGGGDGCDIGAYESDPVLKATRFAASGTEVRVGFNSVLGKNYRLESEGNLDNSWTALSNIVAGTGSANQTLNAGLGNLPRQFYRVVLLP